MAIKDVVKVSRRTFLNPREWLGYDTLKEQNNLILDLAKSSFRTVNATNTDQPPATFDEAMRRQNLSAEDLKEIHANYEFFSWIFLGCSVVGALAAIYYLFFQHSFTGFILGSIVTSLFLTQAFRYNFWAYQIKHKKLGLTFAEWRQGSRTK